MANYCRLAGSRPVVIVVDSDAAMRSSLKFLLEIEGFEVSIFARAIEMLDVAEREHCQCLVIDQDLPCMPGLQAIAAFRARGRTVPAILLSGRPTGGLREEAAREGVALVEKPLLGSLLLDAIQSVCT